MSLLQDPAPADPIQPPPPPREPADHRPHRGRDGGPRRTSVVLLACTALAGGVAGAGALAATGAVGGATTTTVVQPAGTATSAADTTFATTAAASGTLNAGAVYTSTAAGVVDITSRTAAPARSAIGPFGQPRSSGASTATGTGFVLDTQGYVATAAHVVDGATSVTVKLQDGTTRTAKVLGTDDATDLAVLKINPAGLTLAPLALGSSTALKVGDAVAAVGDPFTYERSISTGIVSGLDRTIQAPNGFTVAHAVQTDAAMNPGNSGGPLVDGAGRVIGVVDQIATDGSAKQSSGVGFAVPIDLVKGELAQLKRGQRVAHAYLGIATSPASGTATGALVGAITAGGPAASAGLKAGDVVTAIDGHAVKGTSDLVADLAARKPGDTITLTVERGRQTRQVKTTLGTQPAKSSAAVAAP
jgi:putative serine protease PepD